MIDYNLIGERIKSTRKEKGITQEAIAEKLDFSVGYISQLERGITKINLDTLGKISDVLNTDVSFLISGISPSNGHYGAEEISLLVNQLDGAERKILINQLKSYVELKNHI